MRTNLKKLFRIVLILLATVRLYAQHSYLETEWVVQSPEISSAIYHSSSIVDQGKLIFTGNYNDDGDIDVITVKYDSNGDTLWVKTQSGSLSGGADYGVDVKVNSSGHVIVLAAVQNTSTLYDYAVYHYNGSTGALNWSYTWNGTSSLNDIPTTLELDSYGNIYVAGGSEASGGFSNFGTIKLSPSGSLQWASYYDYYSLHDAATKIVIQNEIIVTGVSAAGVGDWDLATVKLNPSTGAIGTVYRTDIAGATMVEAAAMETDSLNNLYITGYAEVSGNKNVQTIKLDSNLVEVWIRNYSGSFDDEGRDVKVDSDGNVYVTGYTGKSSEKHVALTIKYDAAGNEDWVKEFGNVEQTNGGRAEKIAINDENNVFITGTIANNSNFSSLFFTQYSPNGQVLLSTEYNSLGIGDTAFDIHVVADSVYVSGMSHYVGSVQMTAVKFVLLQEVDYAYFYLNGEESVWCQQPGMYSFAFTDSSQYTDIDSSIISHTQYFSEGIHYIYFKPEATVAQIDSIISEIESEPNFRKEYMVATQTRNNTYEHGNELYAGIDNFIEFVFNDPDLTNVQVDSFASSHQLDVVYYPPSGIDGGVFIMQANQNYTNHPLTSATLTLDIAADLWENDSTAFIQMVTPSLRLFRPTEPNDPFYGDMWWANGGITACNGTATNPMADIELDCAWNFEFEYSDGPSYSGEGVVVAVIDFHGVQWDHPDLNGSFLDGWIAFGEIEGDVAVIPLDSDGSNVYSDAVFEAHLQNVSGVISADIDNEEGSIGVAYNSKIIPCLHQGTSAQFNALLERLLLESGTRQVDVINMSFGFIGMTYAEALGFPFSISIKACEEEGRETKGIIMVAAAGNTNGLVASIPSGFPEVLGVSASNPNDQLKTKGDGYDPDGYQWGSSYATDIDVAAPGICIVSTDFSDSGTETGFPEYEGGGYGLGDYYSFSGTSASSPIVAGIAALILEKDPSLNIEQVYDIIRFSAEKVGGYTYSTPDADGRCLQLGYGRVNACEALQLVDYVDELTTDELVNEIGLTYSNPVSDLLTVSVENLHDFQIIMFNPTGQIVFNKNYEDITTFQIDMALFAEGIYFLNLLDATTQKSVTVKILKL